MSRPSFDLTRCTLKVFAFFGSKDAKHRLRLESLRRFEADVFIEALSPAQRRLPVKKLKHKFNHKHPI